MTNTIDGALAYAQAHPKRDGKSWAGWCESLIWRAGGFTDSFSSAMLAGDASGWLNPDWAKAPRGAIHYWAGVGGDGHVAFELGGGTLLMASSKVSSLGTALGLIHFIDYKLPEYRGWSMRHGTEALAVAKTAEIGITPIPEAPRKKSHMQVIKIVDAGGFRYALVGELTFQEGQLNDIVQANEWAQTWGDARLVDHAGWYQAQNMVAVARQGLQLALGK